ncbi:ABC transporter permease [uncultured Oscillibacter sp.]|uniref:ABC transporter permease n=1 Tax=uncultured Oscillibacter sp. TaxID=876091 RepID=UPI00262E7586|nr:FtsX-like permease family protein [uncultured Oscillibacter sp.]
MADDVHKVVLSQDIARKNGLAVGDTVTGSVVEGVRDWQENAHGTQAGFEIVGIYAATRSEPVSPATQESELQENMLFTDISTAKELFHAKFPERTEKDYTYRSGLMLFLKDPARMEETVSLLKQQPWADWDGLVISENSAAYQQAAGPIQKTASISLFLLAVILVISIVLLSLTLLMWLRERVTEIGILISLGLSARDICGQILLENYMVAAPAYGLSVLLGAALAGQAGRLAGGVLDSVKLSAAQAVVILVCAAAVVLATVLLASLPVTRKRPKDIFTDLS